MTEEQKDRRLALVVLVLTFIVGMVTGGFIRSAFAGESAHTNFKVEK